jgi:hypothetical protein
MDREECFYTDSVGLIDKYLYPFDCNNLNSKMILSKCCKEATIDSSISNDSICTFKAYTITNGDSKIRITHINYKNGKQECLVADFIITKDLFIVDNCIQIGMKKKDFFNKMNMKMAECDTFHFSTRDKIFSYYFNFRNDSLKSIQRCMITL